VAHWEGGTTLAAVLFLGWLVRPSAAWPALAFVAAAAGAVLAWVRSRRQLAALLVAAVGAVGATALWTTSVRLARVEREWEPDSTGVRWRMVEAAGRQLNTDLADAVSLVRRLADESADLAFIDRATAFDRLGAMVQGDGPERGVVVVDPDGRPWAWAGRHRVAPPLVAGLEARITPFYVVLVAGRQGVRGGFAGAHVVLSADAAVPDREATLAARFGRATDVGLRFYPPGRGPYWADVFDYCVPACGSTAAMPDTLFSVRLEPPGQGPYKLTLLESGSRWAAASAFLLLVVVVLLGQRLGRVLGLGVIGAALVATPAGSALPTGRLFSPATYFADTLGPLSASAGALLATAVLVFLAGAALWSRHRPRRHVWIAGALLALGAPLVLGRLAGGITPPAEGSDLGLFAQWQILVTVACAALLVTAAALVKRSVAVIAPAWVMLLAVAWAAGAAVVGLAVWAPDAGWPAWYLYLWLPAVALMLVPAPRARTLTALAAVAGTAAAVLTWGSVAHGRLLLAERDVSGLVQGSDAVAVGLLERFGTRLQDESVPRNAAELYARWRSTALEADRYPAVLAIWSPDDTLSAYLSLASPGLPDTAVLHEGARAVRSGTARTVTPVPGIPGPNYVLSVPFPEGWAVTVGLGPRSRIMPATRVARFLRGERPIPPPYSLSLSEPLALEEVISGSAFAWRREGWDVRGEMRVQLPDGWHHLHATVPLGSPAGLVLRGLLLLVVDLALLAVLWFAAEALAGRFDVPPVVRELLGRRSYRARLGLAFAVFFVVPTVGFAVWTATRLTAEARRSRDIMIRQTLMDASGTIREFAGAPGPVVNDELRDLGGRLDAALLLYRGGRLRQTSDPVLAEFGVVDQYLDPAVFRAMAEADELEVTLDQPVAGRPTRVGYRRLGGGRDEPLVLASPRLLDSPDLVRGEQDLVFGLALVTLGGLVAAAGLASLAARALAKPVQALRSAAEEVRRGELPSPFAADAPGEFAPVMAAFERMASDVHRSRAALEAQRQRTAAVLRNVATGVLALDGEFRVVTSNPRAEEVLGTGLAPGAAVADHTDVEWRPVWDWLRSVAEGREESEPREFGVGDRQVRVQLAGLGGEGWVVALDDVTDLARAVRVLAWGELARQIAHEIKNPLTPIRLGIQHLRRVYEAPRGDFAQTLDQTSRQILAEIERLDAIARAFSRFGAPPAGGEPLGPVDVVEVARDTAALYALGDTEGVQVVADGPVPAQARRDELKEVLINLVENARAARARSIAIEVGRARDGVAVLVRDDGRGIQTDDLPRVFEPKFSTTTSGAGLGLAICKRLVESWGGQIAVESETGRGTVVRLLLPVAAA
jgi:signal transduction histidine kinase